MADRTGQLRLLLTDPAAFAAESFHFLAALCVFAVVLLSPWCFASWEMWQFWPMVTIISVGCLFSGLGVLTKILFVNDGGRHYTGRGRLPQRVFLALAIILPFMAYAAIRGCFPSAPGMPLVTMEKERSLLLFATPLALALITMFSTKRAHRRALVVCMLVNSALIAICALIFHFVYNDTHILWVVGNDFKYTGRASAPFFCPNHFSAFLNIPIAMLLAVAFTYRRKALTAILCVLGALILFIANTFSLSRGGIGSCCIGLTLALGIFGMNGRSWKKRLLALLIVVLAASGTFLAIRYTDNALINRVKRHALWTVCTSDSESGFAETLEKAFWYKFDRGWYIGSALRGWRSNPVWGIGPGQHSNRWPQFAATEDGVRLDYNNLSEFKKPSLVNGDYHLYEVHSDWTQLLEEYGVVGVVLMLFALFGVGAILLTRQRALTSSPAPSLYRALPLAALCASTILFVHSAFDFSLQMPCIVWIMAFLVSAAILEDGEIDRKDEYKDEYED